MSKSFLDHHLIKGREVAFRTSLMDKSEFGVITEVLKDKVMIKYGDQTKLVDKKDVTPLFYERK